jgi:ribonuclease BN (tRNA processing enzyme)
LRIDDRILVLDAGSGIVALGRDLVQRNVRSLDLIISHAHLDHVMGLPYFAPLFRPYWKVTLWFAGVDGTPHPKALLDTFIQPPVLPFDATAFTCDLTLRQLPKSGEIDMGGVSRFLTSPLNHPGGNTGIRIEHADCTFVYCSDFEPDVGRCDEMLGKFIEGADLAFIDSTYTPAEYPDRVGFGHADWRTSCRIGRAAKVGMLGLFHHAPHRKDAELHVIEQAARKLLPSYAVRQGGSADLRAIGASVKPLAAVKRGSSAA